ncbi:general stress protein [Paenibacillus sp. CF384]|uniref:general stress protein n=1 Tax=Paenibacillus sp. CF384 TaxID=1884382 RepID=UPI000896CBAB|nr:general stress protein [Paenibacillus sp. CF384]SDW98991.1 Heat induced stress protein YflT [Paenibacillus sp. CF384]
MTIQTMTTKVHTVGNLNEVQREVNRFRTEGYDPNNIFVLTHDKDRTSRIAENTDAEKIGVTVEGVGTAIANVFRSTGDELRAKMRSLGISEPYAEHLEGEMDKDKILVIAWGGREYLNDEYDDAIYYYPGYTPF